jgi:hypothetical protein
MDLTCSVTQFRIPERIKMRSDWIEQATLERVSPTIYRAGDLTGEAPVWFPQKSMLISGES